MKYSNETSLIGKAANSLDIKGAIIGKTLDFIIQFINNKIISCKTNYQSY